MMADETWSQIRQIFDDALRRRPDERKNFVRQICSGDERLLSEVESLLASLESADSFMETPAVAKVAGTIDGVSSKIGPGHPLGHYEIVRQIGRGGMGEVYLARDTKLERPVALKLLHENLLSDGQEGRRLLREARAAALLDHPHICAIYEISETADCSFIVMQYVEGETLADILTKESLPIETSLDLAIQVADGLAEAHARGIIHRDIKPANIIVNGKMQAKILDFGLAKFIEAEAKGETSQGLNSSGAVMGTVPFMSPEQLRGKAVDERSDLFSFGALLYEMLAGHPAFGKDNNAETTSAILNDEPDWEPIPAELRRILEKCLAKDVGLRYESAAVLGNDLREAQKSGPFEHRSAARATSPTGRVVTDDSKAARKRQFYFWQSADLAPTERAPGTTTASSVEPARSPRWVPAIASLLVLTLGIASVWIWRASTRAPADNFDALRPVRLVSWKTAAASNSTDFRLSHDGKMLAFSSTQPGGGEGIYIKQTSGGADHKVTEDSWRNVSPLWSPDDQQIAFVSLRQDQSGIYVSQTLGGAVTTLKVTEKSNISLRHWSRDGAAIYYEQAGNLYRLDLDTGQSEKITQFEDSTGNDRYFSFSPDETQLVFCDRRDGQKDIWTMRIGSAEPVRLTDDPENELRPMWHPDGKRILYTVSRNDFYQINLTSTGGGTPVQVTRGEGNHVLIDISRAGDRIYYAGAEKKSDIASVDLDTLRESEIAAGSEVELWPDASPDGKWIVYHVNASPIPTIRISESSLVLKSSDGRSVHLPGKGFNARWLPNSRHLAVLRLSETAPDDFNLWLIDTVSGVETRITDEGIMPPTFQPMPITRRDIGVFDFSPDSKRFVYLDKQKPRNAKIGSVETREFTSLTTNDNQNMRYLSARFSPDGTRVALVSFEQFQDKQQKPLSKVQVWEDADLTEVFSTTDNLRLIGWSAAGEVILATTKGSMTASPIDVDIVAAPVRRGGRKLFTLERVYAVTLTMSRDGKMLAYAAPREDRDDIWIASLTGNGSSRRITANNTSRLFLVNPAFSHDGKKLYFDKQEEVNSISMFENLN